MNNKLLARRDFIKQVATGAFLISMPNIVNADNSNIIQPASKIIDWSSGMKPLYCLAYINPGVESHKGQEASVAKFPIAMVPQDDRSYYRQWKDDVKAINPDLKFLAYQMVIEETTVPGPGHEYIRRHAKNAWATYPGGFTPTVTFSTSVTKKRKRIFDPRSEVWQDAFIKACEITLESYPYEGLFLDQCTVYTKAALLPQVRMEMMIGLEQTLIRLREKFPTKLIVGNTRYSLSGLNGEMNEGREQDLAEEMAYYEYHVEPRIELFHYYMKNHDDTETATEKFKLALANKAFFGTGINAQTIRWYDFIDEVLSEYTVI